MGNKASVQTSSTPEDGAKAIHAAVYGLGTDDDLLIKVLSNATPDYIAQVGEAYKTLYKKSMWAAIDDDVSGDFENILEAVVRPLPDYEAKQLFYAMAGHGTSEQVLTEILVGKTNKQIKEIDKKFEERFKRSIHLSIRSETSGHYKEFLQVAVRCKRDSEAKGDPSADADELFKAGPAKMIGCDTKPFIAILTRKSYEHIAQVAAIFEEKYKKSLESIVHKEFSGDAQLAFCSIVKWSVDPAAYVAWMIHEAFKGLGTDDKRLVRLISRFFYNIYPPYQDMRAAISEAYAKRYGHSLVAAIESETDCSYRKMILALVKRP